MEVNNTDAEGRLVLGDGVRHMIPKRRILPDYHNQGKKSIAKKGKKTVFELFFFRKVAFAKKDLQADVILDMATLTGAQGVATGKYHASVLTNDDNWEPACLVAGKASGDLVVRTEDLDKEWMCCQFTLAPAARALFRLFSK